MKFLYNFNLIILLLGALILSSSYEPVTSISLTNVGNIGETSTSDRLSDRKRVRNNNGGFSLTSSSINDQPFNQQDGISSLSRTRGNAVQKFDIEPVDKSAIIGKTVILPCRVLHKVGPLQWTRDGFGLGPDRKLEGFSRYQMIGSDEEGDFSLQIQSVSLEDDAVYQCQVGAAEGVDGIRSRNAALTVFVPPEPPKIVQSDPLWTTAGTTVELTCESHGGKPAAELTWLDGEGNPVRVGIDQKIQLLSDGKRANSALKWTFIPGREHHGKTFTCRAENPALQQPQKAHIRVEVKYKPEIHLTSDKSSYMEGEDIKLSCKAFANPTEVAYKWYRNGELVMGDYTTNLVIPRVTREMNGSPVTCEVTNSVGTSKETYTLDIHYGPVFLTSKSEEVLGVNAGEIVRLKCDPSGNPKPEIAWLYNGSTKVLSTNKELVIPSMSEDKSGRYVCRASVQGFPEVSFSTHVFIKGPPKIISPSIQYIVDDEPVKVECIVHSVPSQNQVIWKHNSQVIDLDNGQGIEVIEDKKPSESITRNILLIHKRSDEYFGKYSCSVVNDLGQDFRTITLTKQKSFPMLIIIATIIGSIVAVVSVTIIVILCMKRKSLDNDDYLSDVKKDTSNSNEAPSLTNSNKTNDSNTLTSNGISFSGCISTKSAASSLINPSKTMMMANDSPTLITGSNTLTNGANILSNGSNILSNGSNTYSVGSNTYSNGSNILSNGSNIMSNGSNQYTNGSNTFTNGLTTFTSNGMSFYGCISQKFPPPSLSYV